MNRVLFFVLMSFLIGCTSSRWIIEEAPQVDERVRNVISTHPVISVEQRPSPENPYLIIEGLNREVVEYPLKVEAKRVIQRYRPRYGWMAFGILGAGTLIYVANSDQFFESNLTTTQRNIFYGSAAFVFTASLLNMRPYGEPHYTGERRYLSEVDRIQKADTTGVTNTPFDVIISAKYNGETLVEGLQKTVNGIYQLNLITELGLRSFSPDNPGNIDINIKSEYDEVNVSVPVEKVLRRYVRVASRNTPLRSSPQELAGNIITNVAEASLLPWVETTENGWHRVMLGVTPTFIRITDGALVWRPAIFNDAELVISTVNSVFGSVDVERNFPAAAVQNQRAVALVIVNERYDDINLRNEHARRSGQLMQTYLLETLGYSNSRIILVDNFNSNDDVSTILNYDAGSRTIHGKELFSDSDLFVYYTGAGGMMSVNGRMEATLLPVDGLPNEGVTVRDLFYDISRLPVNRVFALIDTDFDHRFAGTTSDNVRPSFVQLSSIITSAKPASWVIFASNPSQKSGVYVSSDRRTDRIHGLLTYYFARSLQDGNTDTDLIVRYLERNMTFTSRRLHNRPQDPSFHGNRTLNILRETSID